MRRDSLLKIPLVRTMLSDPNFELRERAIDCEWFYQKAFPESVVGFNPTKDLAYIGKYSQFSSWLKNQDKSPRQYNFKDQLLREVLFAVHDYLHNWAYRIINYSLPDLKFGIEEINSKNFEAFTFCHILTEAVATVGLDYWYLATINLNDIVPIGTNISSLTVKYHENNLKEYLRFNPKLRVQDPSFFKKYVQFYCSGDFLGFSPLSLKQSPIILSWLHHEIGYGEIQRIYTRKWLLYLGGLRKNLKHKNFESSIDVTKSWQKKLIHDVSEYLWRLVKLQEVTLLPPVKHFGQSWNTQIHTNVTDTRFFNINALGNDFWDSILEFNLDKTGKDYLFRQLISKFRYRDFSRSDIQLLMNQSADPNFKVLKRILKNYKPITTDTNENADIFFLN